MSDTESKDLTDQRKNTHGDWMEQSTLADDLLKVMSYGRNWDTLLPYQRQALVLTATKISRILSGDADFADHWNDLAGYAYLGRGGHRAGPSS